MPTIFLIRHAEPLPHHAWHGTDQSRPLSPHGLRQAEWMGRRLATAGIVTLLSAPHQRCRQTAEAIGKLLGLSPSIDEKLHIARSFEVQGITENCAWVAHSNNIPGAIEELGLRCDACGHASAWALTLDDAGSVIRHEYIQPEVAR